uniref:Large ribosomal subunit protein uL4m n=1 Tax=Oncorhynchus tshawytscha TaxID=74940 RepID=A0AAZ3SER3_ONCTS
MFRISVTVCGRGISKRKRTSFSGENALPSNLRIPSNLVDHARRPPPPSDSSLPVLGRCDAVVPVHQSPVQTWVEKLERRDSKLLGLVDLHPDVFAVPTRRFAVSVSVVSRAWRRYQETGQYIRRRGGGQQPSSRTATSAFVQGGNKLHNFCFAGGVSHGPRGPTSFYYMFPMKVRVQGLKIALSSKLAQDYLHVVDTLNIPTPDPQGDDLKTVNVIPGIGLNIHSMLKHEVLVLTLEAVKFLENKLLWHDERFTPLYPFKLTCLEGTG